MATVVRNRTLLLADAALLLGGSILAFMLRFENTAELREHLPGKSAYLTIATYLFLSLLVRLGVLWLTGVYRRLWRSAGRDDLVHLMGAAGVAGFANVLLGAVIIPWAGIAPSRVPLSVLALDGLMTLGLPALVRLSIRDRDRRYRSRPEGQAPASARRVLIAGAGTSGRLVVTEMRRSPSLNINPIGFLDDDPAKQGRTLADLPILGTLADLAAVARTTDAVEVILAIPSAPGSLVRSVTESAQLAGIATRTVPGLFDLVSGRVAVTALREVEISDLLRRETIATDLTGVAEMVRNRRVLVTGAGGSIGSELCRQLAHFGPERLGLLGHGENSIFDIRSELRRRFPEIACDSIICDVRDQARMRLVFETFQPEIVVHAAAHKHVELMEQNPDEAVTNNVLGTRNVAELAAEFGAAKFVMISTDKAVRPTGVMGASKRIAELLVQEIAVRSTTLFVTVRFGNVLGSRGSVVPIFLEQIRHGGPVTVSHPDVTRYFMTIPEAVQLVLQAVVIGDSSAVFALEMGQPVKIVELARDLIRLSGLVPGRDVQIAFSGLKPGEKLIEEVYEDPSQTKPTSHPKLMHALLRPPVLGMRHSIDLLIEMAQAGTDPHILRRAMQRIVPEFTQGSLPTVISLATSGKPHLGRGQKAS